MQTLEQKISDLVGNPLAAKGLELVQIKIVDGAKRKTVQVFIENTHTGRVTLDECAQASRTISALLDVEDIISSAFNLEVGSPGIDRPLVKRADFERFLGFDAKVETQLPVSGRRRFKGQLRQLEGDKLSITVDSDTFDIDISNIHTAKLILNDALMKAHKDGLFGSPMEDA